MAGTRSDAADLSGHGQPGAPLPPPLASSSSPLPPPPSSSQQPAFPSSMAWAPSPWQQPAGASASFWHDPWQPQQHDAIAPDFESSGQFDDAIFLDPMFRDLLPPEQPGIPQQHDAFLTPEYLGSYDHLDDPSFFRAMADELEQPPFAPQPGITQMQQPDAQTTPFFSNHQMEPGAPAMAMPMQGLTDQNGYYWGQGPLHWQPSAAAAEAPAVHAAPPLAYAPPPADPPKPPTGRRPRGRPRGSTAAKSRSKAKAKAKPKPKLATTAATATPEPCHEHPMSSEQEQPAAAGAVAGEEEEAVGGTSGQGAQQQEEDEAVEYADTNLPGVRFQPTDEEIIGYLRRKYDGRRMPADIVRDFNVFQDHPSTVKENFGDSIDGAWYVFSPRDRKYSQGKRPDRSVVKGNHKIGYWKSNTKEESISVDGKLIGSVNNLTFELGDQPHGKPTAWKIKEYRIPGFQRLLGPKLTPKKGHPKQQNLDPHPVTLDDWVIYKLFYKEKKAKQGVPVDVEDQQDVEVGEDADKKVDVEDQHDVEVAEDVDEEADVGEDADEEDDDKHDNTSDGNPPSDGHDDYFTYL